MKKVILNHFNMLRICFISLTFLLQAFVIYGQDTIYLEKDTSLWTAGPKVNFIANSIVETNEKSEIILGFIKQDTYIWTAERLIKFKAGSKIQFDKKGKAIFGILAENTELRTSGGFVLFMKGKEIRLNETGKVIEGYPMRIIQSRIQTKNILFRAGSFIRFDTKGNVISGTIDERRHLDCNDGKSRTFKTGSPIEFDEEFMVIVND